MPEPLFKYIGDCDMKTFIKAFLRDESGASAAEYALIIAIVGVGIGAADLASQDRLARNDRTQGHAIVL